ncbi:MAG TPA: hypothetical protein VNO52_11520, partial [Methylomirabilota bacterium]|nr:hypothetical protein [Methylomirabilota bacterium]
EVDSLVVTGLVDRVAPVYPVAQYSHRDGDAISSGYVYRGQLLPELRGQYVFADITTARLFRADLAALLAADDGNRATTAPVAELTVLHDAPDDTPDRGAVPRRLFDIVAEEYARRGGDAPGVAVLPGSAAVTAGNDPEGVPYGRGRADIRLAMSGEGELFVLSKSDGMIRWLTSATAPRVRSIERRDAAVRIEWDSVPGRRYRVEFKSHLAEAVWTPLGNELTAAELVTATEDTFASEARFYRVLLLP